MPSQKDSIKNLKLVKSTSEVHQRHQVLFKKYKTKPASAWITDSAQVIGENLQNPFKTTVYINDTMKIPFTIGVHKAVGGNHDFPNPGDLLCASLASCFESTLRLIANKLSIELLETKIYATAEVDVRGTLMIDTSIPVEFQAMHIDAFILVSKTNEKLLDKLIKATKQSCIVYQTLKKGIPITIESDVKIQT